MSLICSKDDKVKAGNENVVGEDKAIVPFIAKIIKILANESDFVYWTRSKYHNNAFRCNALI